MYNTYIFFFSGYPKSKLVLMTMKLAIPLLTCYVVVEGFYVTQEKNDVMKLTDLLLSYMTNGKKLPYVE